MRPHLGGSHPGSIKDACTAFILPINVASSLTCAVPQQAGTRLVVLEVESSSQCDSGLDAEAELQWRNERRAALSRCANLKHVFARTARDCPDVTFLTLEACALHMRHLP